MLEPGTKNKDGDATRFLAVSFPITEDKRHSFGVKMLETGTDKKLKELAELIPVIFVIFVAAYLLILIILLIPNTQLILRAIKYKKLLIYVI